MKVNRRIVFRAGLMFVVVLTVIQFVPYGRNYSNPAVGTEPAWDSVETRALAKQACFDCHSNETQWPGYSKVAPVSWLIYRDVSAGRSALNFSEWQRPQEGAKEAAEEVREGEMPLWIYQIMHAPARLSSADRDRLARGLQRTLDRPLADAARGREFASVQRSGGGP